MAVERHYYIKTVCVAGVCVGLAEIVERAAGEIHTKLADAAAVILCELPHSHALLLLLQTVPSHNTNT